MFRPTLPGRLDLDVQVVEYEVVALVLRAAPALHRAWAHCRDEQIAKDDQLTEKSDLRGLVHLRSHGLPGRLPCANNRGQRTPGLSTLLAHCGDDVSAERCEDTFVRWRGRQLDESAIIKRPLTNPETVEVRHWLAGCPFLAWHQ